MPSPQDRSVDEEQLHPAMREAVSRVVAQLRSEGHPYRVFEAFRTPERQARLYAQGRTAAGPKVTRARPWRSYHQFGLAADLVLHIDGKWSWETAGPLRRHWERMHEVGREAGLEPLSWELPHLQMSGLDIDDLGRGRYPDGGDHAWAENLARAIAGWRSPPAAPPPPGVAPARLPLVAVP